MGASYYTDYSIRDVDVVARAMGSVTREILAHSHQVDVSRLRYHAVKKLVYSFAILQPSHKWKWADERQQRSRKDSTAWRMVEDGMSEIQQAMRRRYAGFQRSPDALVTTNGSEIPTRGLQL